MKPLSVRSRRRRRWIGRSPSGVAVDLGSARTRAWTPEHGLLFDVPTIDGGRMKSPVRRGRIVDVAVAADHLDHLLRPHTAGRRLTVVATTPATCDEAHRCASSPC